MSWWDHTLSKCWTGHKIRCPVWAQRRQILSLTRGLPEIRWGPAKRQKYVTFLMAHAFVLSQSWARTLVPRSSVSSLSSSGFSFLQNHEKAPFSNPIQVLESNLKIINFSQFYITFNPQWLSKIQKKKKVNKELPSPCSLCWISDYIYGGVLQQPPHESLSLSLLCVCTFIYLALLRIILLVSMLLLLFFFLLLIVVCLALWV